MVDRIQSVVCILTVAWGGNSKKSTSELIGKVNKLENWILLKNISVKGL